MAKDVADKGLGTFALLARTWSQLDAVRHLLERDGVPFRIHHREFHRPFHRRHPVFRLVKALWKASAVTLDSPAEVWVLDRLREWGRDPDAEPALRAALAVVREIDAGRLLRSGRHEPLPLRDLGDALVAASREAALEDAAADAAVPVHLATFHAAKGLEFDRVFVFPATLTPRADAAEERRAYHVAVTRARQRPIVATYCGPDELARDLPAPVRDLRARAATLERTDVAWFDATPADVVLHSPEVLRAQRTIPTLREGEPLTVAWRGGKVALRHERDPDPVCLLSQTGQDRLEELRGRRPRPLTARVHELFVHLERRKADDTVTGDHVVVLPSIRIGPG
jgi:hypothetical protein